MAAITGLDRDWRFLAVTQCMPVGSVIGPDSDCLLVTAKPVAMAVVRELAKEGPFLLSPKRVAMALVIRPDGN